MAASAEDRRRWLAEEKRRLDVKEKELAVEKKRLRVVEQQLNEEPDSESRLERLKGLTSDKATVASETADWVSDKQHYRKGAQTIFSSQDLEGLLRLKAPTDLPFSLLMPTQPCSAPYHADCINSWRSLTAPNGQSCDDHSQCQSCDDQPLRVTISLEWGMMP